MPKKILIAFPPTFLALVDGLAEREHRNRSDLIREACRQYMMNAKDRERRLGTIDVPMRAMRLSPQESLDAQVSAYRCTDMDELGSIPELVAV